MNETFTEITTTRANHLIDPHLEIWGWEIPVYLFLGGLVAGILVLGALLELRAGARPATRALRVMPFVALGLLSLGMLALFLDLELKRHVARFYLAFQATSPMSWGSWILLFVYPAALLLGLGSLTAAERDAMRGWRPVRRAPLLRALDALLEYADRRRRALLWANVALGAALGLYTGLLLGSLGARPLWNSALLGPLFLTSGLSTGAAFLMLARPGAREHHTLVRWDLVALAAEGVFLALLLIQLATGGAAAREAARGFLGGPWTAPFWSLVIFAGLLVPFVLESVELRRKLNPTVFSAALVLVGGLSLRFLLLYAGQQSSFGVH